jgi:hypothetical protein
MKQKASKTIKPQVRNKQLVPTFSSHDQEAEFWQTHSSEDFLWEDLSEPLTIDATLKKRVRQRASRRIRLSKTRAAQ